MIEIFRDQSADVFLAEAGGLLYGDEAVNGLMLGLAASATVLIRVVEDGAVVSAALQTPPKNLIITFASEAQLRALAEFVRREGIVFPGVVGPSREAELFAGIWSGMTGCKIALGMGQMVYKLEVVRFPASVPGRLRCAAASEIDFVARWMVEFDNDAVPASERQSFEQRRKSSERVIGEKALYLWEVDGAPVSMALASRPTRHGISISAVYTPKELRRRGYASATVAHLSQRMLDAGKRFCVLYTDLANPTSNKIYQEIGYREVAGSRLYLFEGG